MRLQTLNIIGRVCLLLAFADFCASAQDPFKTKHELGMNANPPGVHVKLRINGDQSTFHLFETIPIVLEFTSASPTRYSIEMDEAMNFAGMANRFYVSDADNADFTVQQILLGGVVCCDSDKRILSQRPVDLKRELTDYVRFKKPGTYHVFYVTNRVFRGFGRRDNFAASKLSLTSNQLTLTILPDEADWDSLRLDLTLATLRDPKLKEKYLRATRRAKANPSEAGVDYAYENVVTQTEFHLAQKALNALDTPEAIEKRVALMEMESETDLDMSRKYGSGTFLPQPLLASTTRADLFLDAMEKRARQPDFGIDYNYAMWWLRLLIQKEHPEIYRPFLDDQERDGKLHEYMPRYFEAEGKMLAMLKQMAPVKIGRGKEITDVTIKVMTDMLDNRNTHSPK
jgi:hypothetical protein